MNMVVARREHNVFISSFGSPEDFVLVCWYARDLERGDCHLSASSTKLIRLPANKDIYLLGY
jgi:hypothetical protein